MGSVQKHSRNNLRPTVMTTTVAIALAIVLVALIFDFTNGFHDAANSIATVVSTRVLSPRAAVIWGALFNFVAFMVFGDPRAKFHESHKIEKRRQNYRRRSG